MPRTERHNREATISLRLTAAENAALDSLARHANVKKSAIIRAAIERICNPEAFANEHRVWRGPGQAELQAAKDLLQAAFPDVAAGQSAVVRRAIVTANDTLGHVMNALNRLYGPGNGPNAMYWGHAVAAGVRNDWGAMYADLDTGRVMARPVPPDPYAPATPPPVLTPPASAEPEIRARDTGRPILMGNISSLTLNGEPIGEVRSVRTNERGETTAEVRLNTASSVTTGQPHSELMEIQTNPNYGEPPADANAATRAVSAPPPPSRTANEIRQALRDNQP